MNVSFACPSCSATGSVDAVHIGKQVRCKHCGARFAIPDPKTSQPDVYDLEAPPQWSSDEMTDRLVGEAVFVRARADGKAAVEKPRRKEPSGSRPPPRRIRTSSTDSRWLAWLVRGGVALVLILTALALFAPHGTWLVGCILIAIGGILVPLAYCAGAYGAFSEDSLYGLLYILIPLYAGYYLVTRWEDLWIWITCATIGVGLVMLGTELIRWAGAT